jgi:hypothetical protein
MGVNGCLQGDYALSKATLWQMAWISLFAGMTTWLVFIRELLDS